MIVYMSNVEYLAFGDAKSTITLWCRDKIELKRVIETDLEMDLGNFVFLNNFRSLGMVSSNGQLFLWNVIYRSLLFLFSYTYLAFL